MNKADYLLRLEAGLKRLPAGERKDMLDDFEEHFKTGLEKGFTEEEISRRLGDPGTIAKELAAEYQIAAAERDRSLSSALRAVSAVAGIGLSMLIRLLPVLAAIGGFILLCVLPVIFLLSPFTLLGTMPFYDRTDLMLYIFLSMTTFSLGVLMGALLFLAGKRLAQWALNLTRVLLENARGEGRG